MMKLLIFVVSLIVPFCSIANNREEILPLIVQQILEERDDYYLGAQLKSYYVVEDPVSGKFYLRTKDSTDGYEKSLLHIYGEDRIIKTLSKSYYINIKQYNGMFILVDTTGFFTSDTSLKYHNYPFKVFTSFNRLNPQEKKHAITLKSFRQEGRSLGCWFDVFEKGNVEIYTRRWKDDSLKIDYNVKNDPYISGVYWTLKFSPTDTNYIVQYSNTSIFREQYINCNILRGIFMNNRVLNYFRLDTADTEYLLLTDTKKTIQCSEIVLPNNCILKVASTSDNIDTSQYSGHVMMLRAENDYLHHLDYLTKVFLYSNYSKLKVYSKVIYDNKRLRVINTTLY